MLVMKTDNIGVSINRKKRKSDKNVGKNYGFKRERAKRYFYTKSYAKNLDSGKVVGGS